MRKDNDKRVYLMDDSTDVVYLKNVVDDPEIQVGEHTYYHDFFKDPRDFVKNNILYHFPGFGDKIVIGKYCSIACGTKFICPLANHSFTSLANYPFPIIPEHWELGEESMTKVSEWKGPTIVGNDVWFGFESVIMPGVTIGDGAVIGTRSVVTHDVPPYTVVAGSPARIIRKRFDDATINQLMALKWWDLPDEQVKEIIPAVMDGDIHAVLEKKWLSDTVRAVLERIQSSK
ncbi:MULTISPECIES: CatB-related O-acetyltransferase [Eubacterium]|uniref:Virginiamycin A acetyltransferase n=1 Tax=Eubacterium barkeri TaxID=1528 RepID=A0A1H3IJE1_EUBBA|nr:CatB-related O-acetyltransferase [Eubacterium barkeri]SDY26954.1 virginiamycin A acetyltransferase [Eubacterium barkeri]